MEQHELIRRMVNVDGLSQREVARRLGHSRKTIAKALQTAAPAVCSLLRQYQYPVEKTTDSGCKFSSSFSSAFKISKNLFDSAYQEL